MAPHRRDSHRSGAVSLAFAVRRECLLT